LAENQEAEFHFISRSVIREFYSKDLIGFPDHVSHGGEFGAV
jgi:hypothetical protein